MQIGSELPRIQSIQASRLGSVDLEDLFLGINKRCLDSNTQVFCKAKVIPVSYRPVV